MTHQFKYFLIITFILIQVGYSQVTDKIEISGNKVFSTTEILRWSGLRKGLQFTPDLVDTGLSRISLNLAQLGYHHPDFDGTTYQILEDTSSANILININEGEPTYINEIYFVKSDSLLETSIIKSLDFLKEQIFIKEALEIQINNILNEFENSGYPFINVIIRSVDIYKDSVDDKYYSDVYLEVVKGFESNIDKIEIRGNTSTKDYVIVRELRIERGEIYSQKLIEEFPKRLNRLRFFEPVSVPGFYLNAQNEGVLLIDVKERQTNNFDGIIGYIPPRNDNEKGYLTGLVNISLRNLFGTGRAAAFRWQQFDRNSQDLEVKYLEPWLLGYPFNINLSLYQRRQDTTYVQRKIEGGLEFLATEDISASVFVSSETVIPTDQEVPRFTVFNSSMLTSGISFRIDTRDDPFSPTTGLLFNTAYSLSRKKINGPADFITPVLKTNIDLQRITVSLNLFYELFNRQILAFGLNGMELRGSDFENSDLFRLGGTMSLRGYREQQFLGNRIFWSNFEFRSLLTQRSYAFLFFDTGYYLRNEEPERLILKQEEFKIGYGLGLSLETGLGILAVSFALGQGDSFSDGKIHFGIINEF
ncbi:MAG TPA: BamA/TamA family outer membrane protein [Ignavibacteriaceae bacterium]|nr:BamA/TamA family outer membrane protein [Ignavibacteriaceae bacterium]